MFFTPKINQAIKKASVLHLGQKRKADGTPFIMHPFSVAFILLKYTDNEDIIVAALLHDVLEDVEGYTTEDLKRDFGPKITRIVEGISEDEAPSKSSADRKTSWLKRKESYLAKLRNDSFEALMISSADKIHNLMSMIEEYKEQGESMWKAFNAPQDKKLWFYGEVLAILKKRLDNKIVKELEKTYLKAKTLFKL